MDDNQIVQLYWNRDERAISETSAKYGSYCLSIASNILRNHEDTEECVSDTYLKTWNSIPPNRPKMLSTYLGKIVRNLSFNLYKRHKAEKRGSGQIGIVLDEISELLTDSNSLEEEWNYKLLIETINSFLSELPTKKRNIFVCRYWYADSIKDISERFSMSENNVYVTLNRLRMELYDYLIKRGFEL